MSIGPANCRKSWRVNSGFTTGSRRPCRINVGTIDLRGELISLLSQRVDLLKEIDGNFGAPDQLLHFGIIQIGVLQELAQKVAQARIVEVGAAERLQVTHDRFGDLEDGALPARAEFPERREQDQPIGLEAGRRVDRNQPRPWNSRSA